MGVHLTRITLLAFHVWQEQGLLEGGVVQAVKRLKPKADDEVGTNES